MGNFKRTRIQRWAVLSGLCLFCVLPQITYADAQTKHTAKAPAIDAYRSCKSIKPCLDILKRHDVESFDYTVLANDFYHLGTEGRAVLLRETQSDTAMAVRAMDVLSRRDFAFNQREQSILIADWPLKSPRLKSKVFQANISELFARRAVTTLTHPNKLVRDASRDIIAQAVQKNIRVTLSAQDEAIVRQALIQDPRPALVKLLSVGPKARVYQNLTPVLRSGEAESVYLAYQTLAKFDPSGAFQAMVKTLNSLKDDDFYPAMALSSLLQRRHTEREDGFYMRFAGTVTGDQNMSLMGRVAAQDAHINSRNRDKKIAPLKNTPLRLETFKVQLSQEYEIDPSYIDFAFDMEKGPNKGWVIALNDYFKRTNASDYGVFVSKLGTLKTVDAKRIVSDVLSGTENYSVLAQAITAATQHGDNKALLAQMAQAHPWTDIRVLAKSGLNPVKQPVRPIEARRSENRNANYCSAKFIDPQEGARQMPFFEQPVFANGRVALRPTLKSAASLKDGWLAGYAAGYFKKRAVGGLYVFDYDTGDAKKILSRNIAAIFPVRDMPLGQYENSFWVFTDVDSRSPDHQSLYSVSVQEGDVKTRHIVTYPAKVRRFGRTSQTDMYLGFVPKNIQGKTQDMRVFNPPLILSGNGNLKRACGKSLASSIPSLTTPSRNAVGVR